MELTNREFWGLVHGMVLGAFFLLAFAGGLAELYGLRARWNSGGELFPESDGGPSAIGGWRSPPGPPSSRERGSSTPGTERSSPATIFPAAQASRSPVQTSALHATSSSPTWAETQTTGTGSGG